MVAKYLRDFFINLFHKDGHIILAFMIESLIVGIVCFDGFDFGLEEMIVGWDSNHYVKYNNKMLLIIIDSSDSFILDNSARVYQFGS